jgi:hypothetical protein
MDMLRRITAFEIFHSTDRFRMFEKSVFGKVKNINLLVQEILNTKPQYKALYNCQFQEDEELGAVEWPKSIQGLGKISNSSSCNYRSEGFKTKKIKSAFCEAKPPVIL